MLSDWVGISKSLSGRFLFLYSASSETTEIHFLDLESDKTELTCVSPRKFGKCYLFLFKCVTMVLTTTVTGLR